MKKIIHVDMDCFYAAVEMRENPELANVPLAIGGSRERRGVLSTCNYAARAFGVRSAMPTGQALKLCPDLVLVNGNMKLYQSVSHQIREIFLRYTDIIEPLSLDEAYLDVSDSTLFQGSATLIAQDIRRAINEELNLTASAGVAPIKFVAKIASDENKPDGLFVVTPDRLDDFVRNLPLRKIPGVGPKTYERLAAKGFETCNDVRQADEAEFCRQFGKFGHVIWRRSHGIDERSLSVSRDRKSVGVETTLPVDLEGFEQCWETIESLFEQLKTRMAKKPEYQLIKNQVVKLKFNDFQTTTVARQSQNLDKSIFKPLLTEAISRSEGRSIRLVGLSVGLSEPSSKQQMSFDL